ncbi:hypothetical protein ACFE04_003185 [Oxalis oulophora]
MKPIIVILLVSMLMLTSMLTIHATPFDQEELDPSNDDDQELDPSNDDYDLNNEEDQEENLPASTSSFRGESRMLFYKPSRVKKMTCKKYPKICHLKGSPGRNCCKKKCVNKKSDRHNCGKCGKKCKHSYICCKGKCVNPMKNKKHCGGCGKKCSKGHRCTYGFCNYA